MPTSNKDILNYLLSANNALVEGGVQGVMDYGSTLQKAVTPFTYPIASRLPLIGQYARSPQDAQAEYEQDTAKYSNNLDVQAHPFVASGGRLAGNMAMTAPAMGLFAPEAGAGLGTYLASGAAQGGMQGMLMNQPGQGTSPFNLANGITGMVAGAILSPIQKAVSSSIASAKKPVQNVVQQAMSNSTDPITGITSLNNLKDSLQSSNVLPKKSDEVITNLIDIAEKHLPLLSSVSNSAISGGVVGGAVGGASGLVASGGDLSTSGKWAGIGAGVGANTGIAGKALLSAITSPSIRSVISSLAKTTSDSPVATYLANRLSNMGIMLYMQSDGTPTYVHKDDKPLPTDYQMSNGQTIRLHYNEPESK